MGVILPIAGPILEGPRAQIPHCCIADLGDSNIQAHWARRGLPFRPYLHARISRISGRDRQLPEIIIIIIIIIIIYYYYLLLSFLPHIIIIIII